MNRGILYGLATYFLWGLFPLYWKLIDDIPALEIIGHRIVWSFVFVWLIILFQGEWVNFRPVLRQRRTLLTYALSGSLLAVNWLTYVWAVNNGYIVDSSLGYFINPLVSVVLGVIFLREKLRLWQWIPVGIATLGVLYLTVSYGQLPWIGLTLAFTFATYGYIKKTAPLNSLHSFSLEMGFLALPALAYLLFLGYSGEGAFLRSGWMESLLLAFTGVVTGVPLLLFGGAARRVPLSMLGFMQYLAPTLQFLIGVFVFKEAFTFDRMIGFGLIWIALAIFSFDSYRGYREAWGQAKDAEIE